MWLVLGDDFMYFVFFFHLILMASLQSRHYPVLTDKEIGAQRG